MPLLSGPTHDEDETTSTAQTVKVMAVYVAWERLKSCRSSEQALVVINMKTASSYLSPASVLSPSAVIPFNAPPHFDLGNNELLLYTSIDETEPLVAHTKASRPPIPAVHMRAPSFILITQFYCTLDLSA